jgi:hypothetical protein
MKNSRGPVDKHQGGDYTKITSRYLAEGKFPERRSLINVDLNLYASPGNPL